MAVQTQTLELNMTLYYKKGENVQSSFILGPNQCILKKVFCIDIVDVTALLKMFMVQGLVKTLESLRETVCELSTN